MATTLGTEPSGLGGQQVDRRWAPRATTSKRLGVPADHLEGLGADRSGGPDQADRDRLGPSEPPVARPSADGPRPSRHPSSLPEVQAIFRARTR